MSGENRTKKPAARRQITLTKRTGSETVMPYLAKAGQVLLPNGILPLMVSEPKDIAMVRKAMAMKQTIAIIQPESETKTQKKLFQVGCLGRITTYSENTDGSLYLIVKGTKKFKALSVRKGLLVIDDLKTSTEVSKAAFDRESFLSMITTYLKGEKLSFKVDDLKQSSDENLATSLTMACPFDANEKQAILESKCVNQQLTLIKSFIEMRGYDHFHTGHLMH